MSPFPGETPRSRSLQWRILLPLAGLTVIFAGIGFSVLRSLSVQEYVSEIAKRASTITDSLAYASETAASVNNLQRFVSASGGSPDIGLILVAVGNPARIMASTRQEWNNMPLASLPDAGIRKVIEGALNRKGGLVGVAGDSSTFRYVMPMKTGLTTPVRGYLQQGAVYLEFDDQSYFLKRAKLLKMAGWLLGLCVAGLAMGAWLLIRYLILVPLADVRRTMIIRTKRDSPASAPFLMEGEVGDLARAYNEMLATHHEGEERLKVAHDNFMSFFNLSIDCLCVLDSTGAFLMANNTMLIRLGYSIDELRGQSVLMVHPPTRHAEAGRTVQEMLAGRADFCPVPLQAKDGRLIPVETRIVQGVWDGKPALFGISKDGSALKISEERFSKAFHTGAVMMAISTLRDGRFIDVNQTFLKGLGVAREDIIGHTSAELGIFPFPESRASMLKKFETTGRIVNEEVDFQNRAGELRHGLFSMDTMEMAGETCVLSSMMDITEGKQNERELQKYHRLLEEQVEDRTTALLESERISRTLFEHMEQGVVYQDSDGRITMANSAAERILGLTLDQMKGRDSSDSRWEAIRENGTPFPGAEHPSMLALKTGRRVPGVVMGVRHPADGNPRWILVDAVPEYRSGETKPYRVFTTFTEITERKQIESQLFQAQKLESVGRLAGGVAHDFNNSLYCILGFSELVMNALPADFPQRTYLTQIQKAAEQAAEVTKQLQAFSRRQVILPRPVDVNALIRDQQKMLRRLIGEDIRIELAMHPGAVIAVVDTAQFQQVLMNLCVNARDAMPEGGIMTIETDYLESITPPPEVEKGVGTYVRVVVADTGVGMSPAILANIFEPFFTTKEPGKGTGLGLSVIHGIVRQHGGWIEVKSRPGFGSRFSVYLPCSDSTPVAAPEEPPVVPQGNGEGIMLVEDDDMVRFLATQRLRKLGYRVIEAGSCAQARERFHAEPQAVDLLLSDVVLPDGAGTALAIEFTAVRDDMKVIMSSGYTDEKSRHEEIIVRHWAFLPKPHSTPEIAALLQSLFKPTPVPAPAPGGC